MERSKSGRFVSWQACVAAAVLAGACGTDYQFTGRRASPDGSIVAVSYTRSGGGAAGWCDEKVALLAKDDPGTPSMIDSVSEAVVFSAGCGSKIQLHWISDTELRISYTVGAVGGTETYQRRTGFRDRVHLVYAPQS
jgi:hypothetical protein